MVMSIIGGILVYGTSEWTFTIWTYFVNVYLLTLSIPFSTVIAYTHFFANEGEDF